MFNQLQATEGFVSWSGDIDLTLDAMNEAIRRDARWMLN